MTYESEIERLQSLLEATNSQLAERGVLIADAAGAGPAGGIIGDVDSPQALVNFAARANPAVVLRCTENPYEEGIEGFAFYVPSGPTYVRYSAEIDLPTEVFFARLQRLKELRNRIVNRVLGTPGAIRPSTRAVVEEQVDEVIDELDDVDQFLATTMLHHDVVEAAMEEIQHAVTKAVEEVLRDPEPVAAAIIEQRQLQPEDTAPLRDDATRRYLRERLDFEPDNRTIAIMRAYVDRTLRTPPRRPRGSQGMLDI